MLAWTVRAAQESDTDDLMELRMALQEHLERQNPHIWRLSAQGREQLRVELLQFLSDGDARVLVALDDSETIIGMAIGRVDKSDEYMPAVSGSIRRLFVSEAWRNCGIGTELVRQLCRFFASRHAEDISIRYVEGNFEAVQFWRRLGFQPRIVTAGTKLHDLEKKVVEAGKKRRDIGKLEKG